MILVVGPGRSGTSVVAKALNEMGVSMGVHFGKPDEINPHGYYEDLEFKNLNERFLRSDFNHVLFRDRLRQLIAHREEPWGVKDPRLCFVLGFYLDELPNAVLVRTRRDMHSVAQSMCKCYGWSYIDTIVETMRREACLDSFTVGHKVYEMNLNRKWSDEELKSYLSEVTHANLQSH